MDQDSLMYNAIMNNPQIQLSLTNPKMLLGMQTIIINFLII